MDDLELINRVKNGDAEAFAPLVRRYQAQVRGFCLSMLSNPAEADDAAQDVFVKAYNSIKKFRGDSSLMTWLHRIASNHCLDILRKRTRQKTDSWDALLEKHGEKIEELLGSSPDETNHLENADLIQRTLALLPDDHKNILILREVQNLSYDEIADVLNCSLDAVKARLYRARHDLLEKLQHFLKSANV